MLDLTQGKPFKVLLKYILPLFGSVIFQQLYNIADSVVAGKFIGESALAAVGNSYEITLIYLAFAIGCNIAGSVITAKYFGQKNYSKVKTCISTSFICTIVSCAVLVIIGFSAAPSLLVALNTPDEIYADSLLYINIYTGGLIFLFVYNITTGLFNALGDSKTPFIFLVISSISNIGMDILFVAVFNMGVAGVAWATFICQGVSCILAVIVFAYQIRKLKVDGPYKKIDKETLSEFLLIAVPSAFQQSVVSIGNILLQGLINSFGTSTIAGYAAGIKYNNFAVTTLYTVSGGISNYTAQNLGGDRIDRVKEGYKYGLLILFIIAIPFALIYSLAGDEILLLFLNPEYTDALKVGTELLTIIGPFYVIVIFKLAADGVIRGSERMDQFVAGTTLDLVLRVGISFILAKCTSLGSTGIWISWPIGWILGSILCSIFIYKGKWKRSARRMTLEYVRD